MTANEIQEVDKTEIVLSESEIDDLVQECPEATAQQNECHICDFKSTWENGLKVHMSRKHRNIIQLDGNDSFQIGDINGTEDILVDELYKSTEHYWRSGWIGKVYQSFLDATRIIEESALEEGDKICEKEALVMARKEAFGGSYMYFPPWW